MKKILFAATIVAVISLGSCYNDKFEKRYPTPVDTTVVNPCDTSGIISFATTIQPILTANCSTDNASCHSAASPYLVLTSWNNALKIKATNGSLVNDINFGGTGTDMPKGGTQLSSCNINKITRWAHQGGLNN